MKEIATNMFLFAESERPAIPFIEIGPVQLHSWTFHVGTPKPQIIGINQESAKCQDLSLQCWFSKYPVDQMIFTDFFNYGVYNPWRILTQITIWDINTIFPPPPQDEIETFQKRYNVSDLNPPAKNLLLPSNTSYFLNIRNLQNQDNSYCLQFAY